MASILDIGLTNFFMPIFIFLLVFAALYALFNKVELFGKDEKIKGINAIIAFVLALIVVLSKAVVSYLTFVLPWFFILALIILFFIFIGKMFGKSDENVAWAFSWGTKSPVITWIVIFAALIIIIGFTHIGGQELLEENPEFTETEGRAPVESTETISSEGGELDTASSNYESNLLATIIHPKVMGMLLLCLVGLISILLLTKTGFLPDK